jgi:chitodextrinase
LRRGFTYIVPNAPPAASIISPQNGDTLTAGTQVRIRVSAIDSDGAVARVEVYAGATLIEAVTALPYVVNWTPTTAGTYLLRAVATDNAGAATNSDPITVTVRAPVEPPRNVPPQVSITASPATGDAPLAARFAATASDADGQVVGYRWEFGDGQSSTETAPAHTYETAGTYTAQLTVTDNQGATASASVIITATAQAAPAMRITSAMARGKKLFVFGENFPAGSMILVDGVEKGTRNDEDNPPLLLIAKKGGKGIAVGQTVRLQVRTSDGKLSSEFAFMRSSE